MNMAFRSVVLSGLVCLAAGVAAEYSFVRAQMPTQSTVYVLDMDVANLHPNIEYDQATDQSSAEGVFLDKGNGPRHALVASKDYVLSAIPPTGTTPGNAAYGLMRRILEHEHVLYAIDISPTLLAEHLGLLPNVSFDQSQRPFPTDTDDYFGETEGATTGTALRFTHHDPNLDVDDAGWYVLHDRSPVSTTLRVPLDEEDPETPPEEPEEVDELPPYHAVYTSARHMADGTLSIEQSQSNGDCGQNHSIEADYRHLIKFRLDRQLRVNYFMVKYSYSIWDANGNRHSDAFCSDPATRSQCPWYMKPLCCPTGAYFRDTRVYYPVFVNATCLDMHDEDAIALFNGNRSADCQGTGTGVG